MENVVYPAVQMWPMCKQRLVHACAMTNDDVKTKGNRFLLNCFISWNRFFARFLGILAHCAMCPTVEYIWWMLSLLNETVRFSPRLCSKSVTQLLQSPVTFTCRPSYKSSINQHCTGDWWKLRLCKLHNLISPMNRLM